MYLGKTALGVYAFVGAMLLATAASATSLRYYGTGARDIDRVKIRIDDPANNNPGPPADIGATDITIEFWLKTAPGNTAGSITCGMNHEWIFGNIVIDRDRYSQGRDYGISLAAGRIAFGIQGQTNSQERTICGTSDVRDGQWHHIAAQRRRNDGFMWLWVDGQLQASGDGPDGDVSYPDDGVPGNSCNGPCVNSDPFIVIGAEKHDAGSEFPSYSGWVDELRLSRTLRYGTSGNFTPAQNEFSPDAMTAALYHFNEGSGNVIVDSTPGNLSPGERRPEGNNPPRPEWTSDTPFGASPGTLRFTMSADSVDEAAGSIMLSVQRVGGSIGAATVDYVTADGSATAGADYSTRTGTLTWNSGDAAPKTITIPVIDDADDESNETFTATLSNATGAGLGAPAAITVTINDNDTPPSPGTLRFAVAAVSLDEAAGNVTLNVQRSGGSSGAASLDYATADGSATAGADYSTRSGTLTWADGDSATKTIAVPILDDAAVEPDETFTTRLSNASGAALGPPVTITVTIGDNDTVGATGSLQFSQADYMVDEAGGNVMITVTRTGGVTGQAAVSYATANGSASAGSDYDVSSGTLTWAEGEATSQSFAVPILDDATDEPTETFVVNLSNATGATMGSPASATVTITNDDAPPAPGTLRFTQPSATIPEDVGVLTLTVERVNGSSGAVSVAFATQDGTAAAEGDYTSVSARLTWADGESGSRTIAVNIQDDATDESSESFTVRLSNAGGGATLGSPATVNVSITDNDTTAGQPSEGSGALDPGLLLLWLPLVWRRLRRRSASSDRPA